MLQSFKCKYTNLTVSYSTTKINSTLPADEGTYLDVGCYIHPYLYYYEYNLFIKYNFVFITSNFFLYLLLTLNEAAKLFRISFVKKKINLAYFLQA